MPQRLSHLSNSSFAFASFSAMSPCFSLYQPNLLWKYIVSVGSSLAAMVAAWSDACAPWLTVMRLQFIIFKPIPSQQLFALMNCD